MTFVNCAARGCGTAATSPPWSVQANIQTHRAAPMEAPPLLRTPRPPRRPRPTTPPRLHPSAREAPKHETFSHSGSSPEADTFQNNGIFFILHSPLFPLSSLLFWWYYRFLFVLFCHRTFFRVVQCWTLPYQNHMNRLAVGRSGGREAAFFSE